jgi:hypothetical protein
LFAQNGAIAARTAGVIAAALDEVDTEGEIPTERTRSVYYMVPELLEEFAYTLKAAAAIFALLADSIRL